MTPLPVTPRVGELIRVERGSLFVRYPAAESELAVILSISPQATLFCCTGAVLSGPEGQLASELRRGWVKRVWGSTLDEELELRKKKEQ